MTDPARSRLRDSHSRVWAVVRNYRTSRLTRPSGSAHRQAEKVLAFVASVHQGAETPESSADETAVRNTSLNDHARTAPAAGDDVTRAMAALSASMAKRLRLDDGRNSTHPSG